MTKTYYVVHNGRNPGIYMSWKECQKEIDKFDGAIFKKFTDQAEAKTFLQIGFGAGKKPRIVTRRENDDKKNNSKIQDEIDDTSIDKIFIYTDGSFISAKNTISKGGYGIYIPSKNVMVSRPLLNQKITNNRAELTAIIESVKYLDEEELMQKKICIFTDSQYSMYIFNGTGERYESNGFKNEGKDVPNIDLIKKMLELKRTYNIILLKVRAHTDKKDVHSKANEIVDKLAHDGAIGEPLQKNVFSECYSKTKFTESSPFDNKNIQMNQLFETNLINKNIQMNQLFEFEESSDSTVIMPLTTTGKKKKILKNPKLSEWFIKK